MTKARLRIHDVSRQHHQDTIETLIESLTHARNSRAEGAIVILTDANGRPTVKVGGKLIKGDAALLQLSRLAISCIASNED